MTVLSSGSAQSVLPFTPLTQPIRREIEDTKAKLAKLPITPVNNSPWSQGYSSQMGMSAPLPVTIRIELDQEETIDLVALLPATRTDSDNKLQSFGFPKRFLIEAIDADGRKTIIADHRHDDYPDPGIGPQLFHCRKPTNASSILITVTQLEKNQTWWPAERNVALSEALVFDGNRNVALNARVEASSSFEFSFTWSTACLTDGFSLFAPIDHQLGNPFKEFIVDDEQIVFEFDLGRSHAIDEFRLWPIAHSIQHNYPPSSGIGFPRDIKLVIAEDENFTQPVTLYANSAIQQRPGAGPWMKHTEPMTGRYLRLIARNGLPEYRLNDKPMIGLSEIEFLENGKVVSTDVLARVPGLEIDEPRRRLLTDGLSSEGRILPLRQWITQFQKRAELEKKLGHLRIRLNTAQQQEEQRAAIIMAIGGALILVLAQAVWLIKTRANRRWAKMRERIACDLHDELGANLSSLAHTAELINETIQQPDETQQRLLGNLIENARITSRETKHFIRFIESENRDRNLHEQFNKVADLILGTIPIQTDYRNMQQFDSLDPTTKWNVLMFFKETLNNIIKHSNATAVEASTRRIGKNLQLTIKDNGRGIPADSPPCHRLSSRAKMMGGSIEISSSPNQGTSVTLTFNKKSS